MAINGPNNVSEIIDQGIQKKFVSELMKSNEDLLDYKRLPIGFREKDSQIVGYIDICFDNHRNDIINEVLLGPKCKSSKRDIEVFLQMNGYNFEDIKICATDIPYQ